MAFYNRSTFVVVASAAVVVVAAATVAGIAGPTATKQEMELGPKITFSPHFFLFSPLPKSWEMKLRTKRGVSKI